jgi:hypothetical protein
MEEEILKNHYSIFPPESSEPMLRIVDDFNRHMEEEEILKNICIKEAELFANSHLPVVELVDSACS